MSDFDKTSLHEELEVRVIALLTGELQESEADELEKILAIDPKLSAFRDQMAELMGELHQGRDEIASTDAETPRQLSEERRAKIFGDVSVLEHKLRRKRSRVNAALWGMAASIAMIFTISLLGTIKFVSSIHRKETVFEAMPLASAPQEPEYTVNLQQRNSSTPAPRPPAITVANPTELEIPALDIDVNLDENAVFGRGAGGFAGGLAGVREMELADSSSRAGEAFGIDQVEVSFDFGGTIPVEIPAELLEGTPQPIRAPHLEPAPSEAPRMIVSSDASKLSGDRDFRKKQDVDGSEQLWLYADSDVNGRNGVRVDRISGIDKYSAASLGDGKASLQQEKRKALQSRESGISGSREMAMTYTHFGHAAEGLANAGGEVEETESAQRARDRSEVVLGTDAAAVSGPVDPFFAPVAGSNYKSNVDPFAAPSPSKPVGQVSADRQSEVTKLAKDGRRDFLNGDYAGAADAFDGILQTDPGNAEAKLFASRIDSLQGQKGQGKSRERMLAEVEQAWSRPKVFDIPSHKGVVAACSLQSKTDDIVIPKLNFKDMPLSRAIETLSELSAVYDREGSGVNIVPIYDDSENDPKVTLSLTNVTLGRAVAQLSQAAGYGYDIRPDVITIEKDLDLTAAPLVSNQKSEQIIIPQVNFNGMELSRVVETLRELSKVYDPEQKGVPIEYAAKNGEDPRVNISLRNLNLSRVLQFVTQQVGYEAVDMEGEFIRIQPAGQSEIEKNANARSQKIDLTPKPEKLAKEEPFSTFSLNISDVSYKLAQAALANSRVPPAAQIRTEEFVNSFDYGDPAPRSNEPVSLNWEIAQHPFEHDRQVVRFSVQTRASGRESGQPLNLSLLVDNSGSMQRADRQAILQDSLQTLEQKLKPEDKLNIILFARQPRLIAEAQTRASQKAAVDAALAYRPEGGTNIEAGLKAAYESAQRNFLPTGSNRVILLTDGAANLGNINAGELAEYVVEQRKQGIALDAYGIGWDDYNDALLEEITRNGDGRYAFLNSVADASKDFSEKLAGTLRVAAANVKVQVEWNPDRVKRYRQIGYDLHQLKKEDFRDNTVDAAEIAEAESGTALYVLQIDDDPEIIGGLGTLRVRYQDPSSGLYKELSWPLAMPRSVQSDQSVSPAMRLAMSSALFGERLANSPFASGYDLRDLYTMTSGLPEAFPNQPRVAEMQTMMLQASELYGEK